MTNHPLNTHQNGWRTINLQQSSSNIWSIGQCCLLSTLSISCIVSTLFEGHVLLHVMKIGLGVITWLSVIYHQPTWSLIFSQSQLVDMLFSPSISHEHATWLSMWIYTLQFCMFLVGFTWSITHQPNTWSPQDCLNEHWNQNYTWLQSHFLTTTQQHVHKNMYSSMTNNPFGTTSLNLSNKNRSKSIDICRAE